jgi:hypothetical protein
MEFPAFIHRTFALLLAYSAFLGAQALTIQTDSDRVETVNSTSGAPAQTRTLSTRFRTVAANP